MFGTLAGALSGRNIPFDRSQFTAAVDGRIVGVGRTIRIESIALHYDLTAPAEHREAIERALRLHPEGCPAHQSVKEQPSPRSGRDRRGVGRLAVDDIPRVRTVAVCDVLPPPPGPPRALRGHWTLNSCRTWAPHLWFGPRR